MKPENARLARAIGRQIVIDSIWFFLSILSMALGMWFVGVGLFDTDIGFWDFAKAACGIDILRTAWYIGQRRS